MQAIILSIGDELVLGQTIDTNSAWLSAALARLGIGTRYHQTVADDRGAIAQSTRRALGHPGLLIISGGLGPTEDDLTRQALADALSAPLVLDASSVDRIAGFFQRRGRPMPHRNRVQAMHPQGTTMIANGCGTAPGIRATVDGTELYVVPGVPSEMRAMFEASILPDLGTTGASRHVILTTKINTFGLGESDVAERLGDLMARDRNPTVGTTVADAVVSVRVRSEGPAAEQAGADLEGTVDAVSRLLGPVVYGRDDTTLQQALVQFLRVNTMTVATAESCTGGLVGEMITEVPGSSAVYQGGWVTYTDAMKVAQLGISKTALALHGAVSQPVARQMAAAAREKTNADIGVALTGIAGPGGGTSDKPVGTVWVGLSWERGEDGGAGASETDAFLLSLGGDRATVRQRAARAALQIVRFHAMGVPIDALPSAVRQPMPSDVTA